MSRWASAQVSSKGIACASTPLTETPDHHQENVCVADQFNTMIRIVAPLQYNIFVSDMYEFYQLCYVRLCGLDTPLTTSKLNYLPYNPSEIIVRLYSVVRGCVGKTRWFSFSKTSCKTLSVSVSDSDIICVMVRWSSVLYYTGVLPLNIYILWFSNVIHLCHAVRVCLWVRQGGCRG